MLFQTDAACWSAIVKRDASADGHFIYAVKTTGIFCRPNCKARLARRANVKFFSSCEEAISDGFRACKRCKPERLSKFDPQEEWITKGVELIKDRVKEMQLEPSVQKQLDLKSIAKGLGVTISHFHHVFKNLMQVTPKQFARSLEQQNLSTKDITVCDLASNGGGVDHHVIWDCLPTPTGRSQNGQSNENGIKLSLVQADDVSTHVEHELAGSGDEFVDWDAFCANQYGENIYQDEGRLL